MIGSSLGPYRIVEKIGAGGMGEVFLAEDTRLNRKVAIKVLPAEFATDPERLARFEQEAQAAAALNHPHIAAVFDVGSETTGEAGVERAAATHFIVQEYLEGKTLRGALANGPLPVGKALLLAREVAEALAAAHGAGIVHRDVKPDNVFVTREGHAKVLDFGLAKLTEITGPGGQDISMSPTVLGTIAGQVMGTAGYMAPEQVQGEVTIDRRADLFAFGSLLYEMVGGKRAFSGESVLDTLHAIARSEPRPLAEINDELPADLERIVKKCLAKDREHRYQHAEDLLVDLRSLAAEVEAGTAVSLAAAASAGESAAALGGVPWTLAAPAAVAIAVLAVLATWFVAQPTPESRPVARFVIPLPEEVILSSLGRVAVSVSPTGRHVAFSANDQVWLRALNDPAAVPLRGTEGGGRASFFSPDGEWVGFYAEGALRKVPISGGQAVKLCDALNPWGASWTDDGRILYGQGTEGIWEVAADGGEPTQLIAVNGALAHGPQLLPDGVSILYTLRAAGASSWEDAQIVVQRPGEEPTVLVPAGRDARYLPTGHLLYAQEGSLFARPFDPASLEVGGAVPLIQGVSDAGSMTGASHYGVSRRGDLVFLPGEAAGGFSSLVWRDESGNTETLIEAEGRLWTPRLSPDGRYLAYRLQEEDGDNRIWMRDLERNVSSLFTPEGGARSFAWSPDGEWLYYSADTADEGVNVFRRPADLSADAEELISGEGNELVRSISPDGEWLLLADTDELNTGAYDIAIYSLSEGGEPQPLFDREVREITATFSPNGKWLAYVSEESGTREVFVQSFPNRARITNISGGRGYEPLWARDSRRLFFRTTDDLMVVDILDEEPFRPSAPRVLLPGAFFAPLTNNAGSYDISLDGDRLLMVQYSFAEGGPRAIEIILNWFAELEQRVPKGR
jgi:serine/threonine-protein kinase